MAGKAITGISFPFYDDGSYIDGGIHVKVYMAETNASDFYKSAETKLYRYFDKQFAPLLFDDDIQIDTYSYGYTTGFVTIEFDTPFYYSGENNLVLTVDASDAVETTSGAFYVNFFDSGEGKVLTFANDSYDLGSILDGNSYAKSQYSISVINAPVMQFTYENGTAPAETWASYVPTMDVDLDINGFEAYKVTGVEGASAKLERVTTAKKGEPLLLVSSVTASVSPAASAVAQADNQLKVSDGSVTGGNNIYALSKKNGKFAFYRVASSVTIPEGKIYLEAEAGARESLNLNPESGDATAISTPAALASEASDALFDLQGRRASTTTGCPAPSIYVRSGKKFIVK